MSSSTPIPIRQIGHEPTPAIVHDLGEVTANYPVGALTKGVNLENPEKSGLNPDTLDFMLTQFRKDYIANATTEPNDLLREEMPQVATKKSKSAPMQLLTELPAAILILLSLVAGGAVALILVGPVLIYLWSS
jgi:hypothetical protein